MSDSREPRATNSGIILPGLDRHPPLGGFPSRVIILIFFHVGYSLALQTNTPLIPRIKFSTVNWDWR